MVQLRDHHEQKTNHGQNLNLAGDFAAATSTTMEAEYLTDPEVALQ